MPVLLVLNGRWPYIWLGCLHCLMSLQRRVPGVPANMAATGLEPSTSCNLCPKVDCGLMRLAIRVRLCQDMLDMSSAQHSKAKHGSLGHLELQGTRKDIPYHCLCCSLRHQLPAFFAFNHEEMAIQMCRLVRRVVLSFP